MSQSEVGGESSVHVKVGGRGESNPHLTIRGGGESSLHVTVGGRGESNPHLTIREGGESSLHVTIRRRRGEYLLFKIRKKFNTHSIKAPPLRREDLPLMSCFQDLKIVPAAGNRVEICEISFNHLSHKDLGLNSPKLSKRKYVDCVRRIEILLPTIDHLPISPYCTVHNCPQFEILDNLRLL